MQEFISDIECQIKCNFTIEEVKWFLEESTKCKNHRHKFLSLKSNEEMVKKVSSPNLEFPTDVEDCLWVDVEILGTRSYYKYEDMYRCPKIGR